MKDQVTKPFGKFVDPKITADGQTRAVVELTHPETLWFNTGTLCNIECSNCYIASSPTNDALVYLSADEVRDYLDQLEDRKWPVSEIGITGGEPFMNPDIIEIIETSLSKGYRVLVLSNAMRPMRRPNIKSELMRLHALYGTYLTIRVSLDHYSKGVHDLERGSGSYARTLDGLCWLRDTGINTTIAGRVAFAETEQIARAGFAKLFQEHQFAIDPQNPVETVLFPEMDLHQDVPEITTACWGILGKSPDDIMCASSRMVVKRKGARKPAVLACTLIAYDADFEMGPDLKDAESPVSLNHPHCAKFCVLGGASCSA